MKKFMFVVLVLAMMASQAEAALTTIVYQNDTTNDLVTGNYAGHEDTTLNWNRQDANAGAWTDIILDDAGWILNARALMRWDLSSLAGQYLSIQSVTMSVSMNKNNDDFDIMTYEVLPGNKAWVEGRGTAGAGDVLAGESTWNSLAHDDTSPTTWASGGTGDDGGLAVQGTDYSNDLLGSMAPASGSLDDVANDDIAFDGYDAAGLMTLIDNWSGNQADNAGIMMVANKGWLGYCRFSSSETGDGVPPASYPKLTIVYDAVPEPNTLALLATGSLLALLLRRRRR